MPWSIMPDSSSESHLQEQSAADARTLFEVNFFAPAQLIRICLPLMETIRAETRGEYYQHGRFPGSQ